MRRPYPVAPVIGARPRRDLLVTGRGAVMSRDDAAGLLDGHVAGARHPLEGTESAVIFRKVCASGAAAALPPRL